MKRPFDEVLDPELDAELPRCLPDWFLEHLEPYLPPSDLSSLARCCKFHMLLCYRRIAKLSHWGDPQFHVRMGNSIFPPDAYLQMQFAKTILLTPREPLPRASIPSLLQSLNQTGPDDTKTYFDSHREKIAFPFRFEEYLTSMCFSTAARS